MTDLTSCDRKLTAGESGSLKWSKKKQKKEGAWRPEEPRDPFAMLDSLPEKKQQEIQKALHLFSLGQSLPKTLQDAKKHTYRFWNTQPVPKLDDSITTHGPIAEVESSIRNEPYSLPLGFSWESLDLSSLSVLKELCDLLNENYTEEDDNTFRREFSLEYLQWALHPPNWLLQWHLGVRVDSNKKLVGFIAAVPAETCIYETKKRLVQVKFLCVHKKLQLKRMTPVLIRELARRVSQQGLYQAEYTTGIVLPTPLSSCSLWQRPLNPRKLMDVSYPGLRKNMNLKQALKFNRLPEVSKVQGLRPMIKGDAPGIHSLLKKILSKFHLSPLLSLQEVEHWFLPRENVNDTYVVEREDGTLTDAVSFYSISLRVLNHPVHRCLRAAYLLYIASNATELAELMENMLVLAKSKGFDVFCALDVMDNTSFLEKLKFTISDKRVYYYLYNWMCPLVSPNKVGLVMPD